MQIVDVSAPIIGRPTEGEVSGRSIGRNRPLFVGLGRVCFSFSSHDFGLIFFRMVGLNGKPIPTLGSSPLALRGTSMCKCLLMDDVLGFAR